MFGKYADRIFHFQGTLDNFYSHQHKDGFICREIVEATGEDCFLRHNPSATGPDVMAWCEWEYFLNFGDRDRLEKVFPPLMAYHRWMAENHTWPDGTYFSTGWGCGMDNMPRQIHGNYIHYLKKRIQQSKKPEIYAKRRIQQSGPIEKWYRNHTSQHQKELPSGQTPKRKTTR